MKIIIAGAGDVGSHLATMLSAEKHQIMLIDYREEKLKQISSGLNLSTYKGSVTSIDTLTNAGVQNADLFISVTNSEDANISASILAKKLGAHKCLTRIDNLEYLSPDKRAHFTALGVDYMFYPEQCAATEIVSLIGQSATSDVMTFADGKLMLYVMRMSENAPALNQSLEEFHNLSRNPEYKVVGIVRNNNTLLPKPDEKLIENDLVYIVTTQRGIELLVKYFGKKSENVRSVMILGGSRIGINTARQLGREQVVKLLEKDRTKSYELANQLQSTLVINGDGRNIDLLQAEGIANTDVFIALTGDPEINMIACLLAKKLGAKKTIAEIENNDYIRLAENMDIDVVINKKIITASKIFSFTMADEVSAVKCLTCSNAEILEYVVKPDSRITSGKIDETNFPAEAVIGGIVRGNVAIIPDNNIQIKPFDKVIVFALPEAINTVGKFFNAQNRFF